ncbi:MAG: hypothetical protein OXG15_10130 [Gammaproteobacteria bacterium]|nr:hypothetical protein [Gammaproteobacteria bacterium]
MAAHTTPFLFSLNPSELDEPSISNEEFLQSLDTIGVWLRVFAAYDSLQRYSSSESSSAQRLAALSNIYLQLGAQLEDQAVSLVAFSIWSKNRDLVLADLFARIVLRRAKKKAPSEVHAILERFNSKNRKKITVDQRSFFQEVAEMPDAEIVELFLGYKWRAKPSVKLIPARHMDVWKNLPADLRRIADSFHDAKQIPRITAAYNKLKHGPQLVSQNPADLVRRFGTRCDHGKQLARHKWLDRVGIRLLFAGSRTRPESTEVGSAAVAPFLIDDERAVRNIFFDTMVYQATLFQILVKMQIALYRKESVNWGSLDKGISRIIEEAHGRSLASKFLSLSVQPRSSAMQ